MGEGGTSHYHWVGVEVKASHVVASSTMMEVVGDNESPTSLLGIPEHNRRLGHLITAWIGYKSRLPNGLC